MFDSCTELSSGLRNRSFRLTDKVQVLMIRLENLGNAC